MRVSRSPRSRWKRVVRPRGCRCLRPRRHCRRRTTSPAQAASVAAGFASGCVAGDVERAAGFEQQHRRVDRRGDGRLAGREFVSTNSSSSWLVDACRGDRRDLVVEIGFERLDHQCVVVGRHQCPVRRAAAFRWRSVACAAIIGGSLAIAALGVSVFHLGGDRVERAQATSRRRRRRRRRYRRCLRCLGGLRAVRCGRGHRRRTGARLWLRWPGSSPSPSGSWPGGSTSP